MKNLILNKPYNLLLIAIILLAVLSFVHLPNELDINIDDTYVVIATKVAIRLFVALCVFCWLVYFAARRYRLIKVFTWIHLIGTLVFIVSFFKVSLFSLGRYGMPRRYYTFRASLSVSDSIAPYIIITIIFVAAQALFIVNIIYGAIKKYKANSAN